MFNYSEKTVVVIGGTSGINRGVAVAFAKGGANVAVASRSRDKVDETVDMLREYGGLVRGFVADVRNNDDLETGLNEAAASLGEFDVVVSGAAGNFPALFDDMSDNGFKSVMNIDLLGSFHVLKSVRRHLQKTGASLINISAPQSFVPMAAQAHVCAAKAGVDMLTRCLALEWGPENIRVNSVVPGPTESTEGMARLAPGEVMVEMVRESVPLKRLGKVEDVANLCLFLGSELSSYLNGAVIPVDGGWSLAGAAISGEMAKMLSTKGP